MEMMETRDLIRKVKELRNRDPQKYTIKYILSALEERGANVAETTLRRIFADDSEVNDSFSYRSIKPVAEFLIEQEDDTWDDATHLSVAHAKIDLLMAVIDSKNGLIERQSDTIGQLKTKMEALQDQIAIVREECARQLSFLRDQIEKKDRRMDEKDEIIRRLMDKVLQ